MLSNPTLSFAYGCSLLVVLASFFAVGAVYGKSNSYEAKPSSKGSSDYAVCDLYSAESRAEDTHKKISDRYEEGFAVHYIQYYDNQDNTVCYISIGTDAATPKGKR